MSERNEFQQKDQLNQQNAVDRQTAHMAKAVGGEIAANVTGGPKVSDQSIWDSAPQPVAVGSTSAALAATQRPRPETEETKRMKENFGFFGPVTFLYAVFYAFCMYRNGSGVTFPFFVAGSLLFLYFSLSKLGTTLKRGSVFYMAAIVLLGISTFCTDDGRLIIFNKLGVFLLMMSLLLKQFFDTSGWKLGKFLAGICQLVFGSFGELGQPFSDLARHQKNKESDNSRRIWYFLLGLAIGVPILLVVLYLLASADAVFRQMTGELLENIRLDNILNVLLRITFIFFASYGLTSYLCRRRIVEAVPDKKSGEPILAITITGLLTMLYLLFCGIQIGGLFLGKLRLPEGYTYAMYAREGFFQLLAVSFINLVIVLVCISFFKDSKVLKTILTVMSLCTFVMIASSAMRMTIYISFYYLTFLRILVLWSLGVLALLFAGVVESIFREDFPLFRYSVAVVTVLYLALSFVHPDYLIAKVNVENVPASRQDYYYLIDLSADAAPVLVPYLEELGYDMEAFAAQDPVYYAHQTMEQDIAPGSVDGFGYYWMRKMQERTNDLGIRTFNVSRFMALQSFR